MHVKNDTPLKVCPPAHPMSQINPCCVFSLVKAVIASPLCYYHVFLGVSVSVLCDRFSSTDSIDLLLKLTHRVQRHTGNPLKRANERVLLSLIMWRESFCLTWSCEGIGRCGFHRCLFTSSAQSGFYRAYPAAWNQLSSILQFRFDESILLV